jgi:hypothetical protein
VPWTNLRRLRATQNPLSDTNNKPHKARKVLMLDLGP